MHVKRFPFIGLTLLWAFGSWGQTAMTLSTSASQAIRSRLSSQTYSSAQVSVCVLDGETSQVLFDLDGQKSVSPASCLKTVTSAAAMHLLGPDKHFTTTLEARGKDATPKGQCQELIIRGEGDPTFGSNRVEGSLTSQTVLSQMAEAVHKAGIREIRGSVWGDDSFFSWQPVPDCWQWEDIGNYYGAGPSGLCFHDNLYYLYFQPGKQVGDPAAICTTDPPLPRIIWSNGMKTGPSGSGDQGWIYGTPGSWARWTRGTIPLGGLFNIKGSIPDPALALADLLEARLKQAGVKVHQSSKTTQNDSPADAPGRVLAEFASPPLHAIVKTLMKQSFNLYPETLLLHIARQAGDGSRDSGLHAEHEYLEKLGVNTAGVHIEDGSGLSSSNKVTAMAMAQLLVAAQREPYFSVWRESFPVLGIDGDLSDREQASMLRGKVRAKTGLITRVRGLCGYMETKSGKTVCFALFANEFSASWTQVDKDFDAVLRVLFENL